MPTLDQLRTHAAARTLFRPTTIGAAIRQLGFVQADPIRAPARAQDLILRHRVRNYRAGDLERRYARLDVEEDFFVNYGFLPREVWAVMHPRVNPSRWLRARRARAQELLAFVRERGTAHPRDVDAHFSHGTVTNYWGGSSNATTHLLNEMHYGSLLRVAGRQRGIRLYAAHDHPPLPVAAGERDARVDRLVDVAVQTYAPLPALTLSWLVRRLQYTVPQWRRGLTAALKRAQARLAHVRLDGVSWYWPVGESPEDFDAPEGVRLLAPFDPIVWDRRRFELLWKWTYRFEAYTPVKKRKLGYYALPLLWRDAVVGWSNVSLDGGRLVADVRYAGSQPRERAFKRALDEELERMRLFLAVRSA